MVKFDQFVPLELTETVKVEPVSVFEFFLIPNDKDKLEYPNVLIPAI
jgi:hypothetical protein